MGQDYVDFYTPPHYSGGVLWYHVGCPSVCLSYFCSYFHFWTITGVNISGLSPNSVCALILWRFGLGLLMGNFCQFLTELSARNMSVFSFPDDNFSKYLLIFTKRCVH